MNKFSDDSLKKGEELFRKECVFVAAAQTPDRIPPPTRAEIAFAGRSNVGKSSLINALTSRKGLARSSNTPGRTQQINFFDLGGRMFLADLPGYGYAKASKEKTEAWNDMVRGYLRGRPTLKIVCLLIDARHGLKAVDQATMEMLDNSRVPYAVVLTKADKLKMQELEETVKGVKEGLAGHASACLDVYPTSSDEKSGIPELREFLAGVV